MSTFWRVVWIVARKDLAIEARSRELLNTTIFFALSCVIVFSVSFVGEGGDGRALGDAAAGILWVAIAFSGTLALGRTFERERYGDTLRALLLAPGARAGGVRRQAASASSRCSSRPRSSSCRWSRCCSRRGSSITFC